MSGREGLSGREERKRSLGSGHVSCLVLAAFFLLAGTRGWSQTSQATLQGRVLGHATGQATGHASSQDIDQLSGQPIAGALVILRNQLTNTQAYRYTNEKGIYYFSSLMPGTYTVRTDALDFQPEQRSPVELAVAARVELNFDLEGTGPAPAGSTAASAATSARRGQNPSNILSIMYGADAAIPQAVLITLPFFGSDSLLGAISSLIDENKILELPLSGRDVYTLLVLQPGVSSDNATSRGLGFSVNGQQVSSSNFLLNGVDNNDLLVTGPATKLSADAVKEYRMNTNNFTAEFGRNAGFIANVITKSGANRFHGTVYEFFNHDRLNAGSFSDNWQGLEKVTFRQNQFGSSLGGPIKRDRLFFFANLERLRSVSQGQPVQLFLPSPALVATAAEDSIARRLFSQFPAPEAETITGNPFVVRHIVSPPIAQTSTLAFGRLDYSSLDGRHRLGTHFAFSQQSQDDVAFSVYPGFNAPLISRGVNFSQNYTSELFEGTNELKFGFNRSTVEFFRPHPEIPTLTIQSGGSGSNILLPGSDNPYDYFFQDSVFHLLDNFNKLVGRHALSIGFEWRPSFHHSLLSLIRDGRFAFNSIFDFLADNPFLLEITVNRQTGLAAGDSDFRRRYFQNEWAVYYQDNWKLTPRLTMNLGVRWDYFGAPSARDGTRDFNFVFGPGATPGERIAAGDLAPSQIYRPDRNNIAPRFGFAYDLDGSRSHPAARRLRHLF